MYEFIIYIYNILAYNQHKGDVSLKNKVLTVDSSQHIRIFYEITL